MSGPAAKRALAVTGVGIALPDAVDDRGVRRATIVAPERFGRRALRRVSRLGQLALVATESAWQRAQLAASPEIGLVVGTSLADIDETAGFLDTIQARGGRFASPGHFQRSVHAVVAGELAILYRLEGYNLTVTQGRHSGETALQQAAMAVRAERCSQCVCVAVDGVSDALVRAWRTLGCSPSPPQSAPLSGASPAPARGDAGGVGGALPIDGMIAEGAAALVIEPLAAARARGAAVVARFDGVDLVAAQRGPYAPDPELGVHGAVGLLRAALAVDGDGEPPHWLQGFSRAS